MKARRAHVTAIIRLLGLATLALDGTAASGTPPAATELVIVAGQEAALAVMLGQGRTLPGDCRLAGGRVERAVVIADYACAAGPVSLELRHATAAPAAVARTARFAILPRNGDPPEGLVAALVEVVRSRETTVEWRDVGIATESYPLWRSALRVNVYVFLAAASATLVTIAWVRRRHVATIEAGIVLALTALAGVLRFVVASPNLMDFGGVPYSRWLRGYKGHLGAAELLSVVAPTALRDIEHAITLDRVAGTLTVPLVHLLCRRLRPELPLWPTLAALLVAVSPLHVAFSASDSLSVLSGFLAVASYVLLTEALHAGGSPLRATVAATAAFSGLALLTQVRYENALLLAPAALLAIGRRSEIRWRCVGPPLLCALGLVAFYAQQTATFGLSYTNAVQAKDVGTALRHVVTSRFVGIPLLLLGTAAVVVGERRWLGAAALLPWVAAFGLAAGSQNDGHSMARLFVTWLIVILPLVAYGLTLMLRAPRRATNVVGAVMLLAFVAQPIVVRDRLRSRHLEILEHDRFAGLLERLPSGVTTLIVPDDGVLHRRDGATFELKTKYELIVDGAASASTRPRLVGVTEFNAHPERARCDAGACVFFFGLPCFEQDVYVHTAEQCRELLRRQRTSVVDDASVRAAPFARCSIHVGGLHDEVCAPATREQRFTLHRLEGDAARQARGG